MHKPSSPSVQRNKEPILEELKRIFAENKHILEIGSGTGEHAVHFSTNLGHLKWTTADRKQNHLGIKSWVKESANSNLFGPFCFDVGADDFPAGDYDGVFLANVIHIMPWKKVKTLFKMFSKSLTGKTKIVFYGPFKSKGNHTSQSNEDFDLMLRDQDPKQGVRSIEDVANNMAKYGFFLKEDIDMPSNNKILLFEN